MSTRLLLKDAVGVITARFENDKTSGLERVVFTDDKGHPIKVSLTTLPYRTTNVNTLPTAD